ncbi:hypothetical protein [Neobacillus niacini]|uniref:hypothetical protein n=1 Tax=Neobacillus niacini TaxID=86668 RepID=UPI00286D473B|nr:hypothetical protein [Neobacillus niacini]
MLILFPLDTYDPSPVILMDIVEGDPENPIIWGKIKAVIDQKSKFSVEINRLERFDFYGAAQILQTLV